VRNTLTPNEELIYVGAMHWIVFAPGVILTAIWLMIVFTPREPTGAGILTGSLFFVGAAYSLIRAFIIKSTTELAITTKRVIAKTGFIRRDTVDLNHARVESYHINQGVIGRILDYGNIIVCGTGGARTPIRGIANPLAFRREAAAIADAAIE
jgi:uncharacterized membrane protein YdbT with pleckstrin-like domain